MATYNNPRRDVTWRGVISDIENQGNHLGGEARSARSVSRAQHQDALRHQVVLLHAFFHGNDQIFLAHAQRQEHVGRNIDR